MGLDALLILADWPGAALRRSAIAYPLVAVIGDDLGEELVGAGQEQSSAQGAAELPHEGAGAQALAADPAEALR